MPASTFSPHSASWPCTQPTFDRSLRDPEAQLEALETALRRVQDELTERAFILDRRGRADAADELNAVAARLRELLSD